MSDNITPLDSDVCNVTFDKKEYAIVGDAVFAQSVVGVPNWMQELVGDLVATTNSNTYDAMSGFNLNLYNAMLALQVAENQYTQVINSKITDQEAFVQAVETLNSTAQNAVAEIVGIKQTYATKDFALATAAQTLEASLNGGAIKSSLGQLASTMTNQYGTMAQRMDVLESIFEDQELKVEGYANATNTLETYVGLTQGAPDGTGLIAKVKVLQKQNDGLIETVTGTHDVMTGVQNPNIDTSDDTLIVTAEPYNSWKPVTGVGVPTGTAEVYKVYTDTSTGKVYQYDGILWEEVTTDIAAAKEQLRSRHVGDVYIKYNVVNGVNQYEKAFKFIKTIVDTTEPNYSTDSEGYTWALVTDTDAALAYQAALNAKDLADGKRRVFTDTPVGPYDIGDLWVRVVGNSNQIWRSTVDSEVYDIVHWQVASTDDAKIDNFIGDNVGTTVDALIDSYKVYVDDNLTYRVDIYSSQGNMFRNGVISATLTAKVFKGPTDITDTFIPSKFSWVRTSGDSVSDGVWNSLHSGVGSSIIIGNNDVFGKAVFTCTVTID